MKCNVMFLALLFTAFLFPTVGSVSNADAQPGSRLCGISVGAIHMLVEIKQPNSKKGRKKMNRFCDKVANGVEQELKAKGIDTANAIFYKRTECEAVARDISRDKSSFDICDLMKRTSVGNGANPYTITWNGGDNFEATRQ